MNHEELHAKLLEDLQNIFGEAIIEKGMNYGMPYVIIDNKNYHDCMEWLKKSEDWKFNHFIDITAVDYFKKYDYRFEVVVHLRSHSLNTKVRIKTRVRDEKSDLPTISDVFIGASWPEREIFDFFGIKFKNHPRMTRLLSPDDFDGHPLLKDFPVKGKHRGSFPRGTVISNKRREAAIVPETKPRPADQLMPNTPVEQKRVPMREGGDDA